MHKEKFHKVTWRCPSNIAIVKYWGKKQNQLPCNSSVSLTLSKCFTETTITLFEKKTSDVIELEYFFEAKRNENFQLRIKKYLQDQSGHFPFLKKYGLKIESLNSFPHSAGIASSASSFGALALCLLDISTAEDQGFLQNNFFRHASNLARLGSGSAARSVFAEWALWGRNAVIQGSSDEYAIPLKNVLPDFQNMKDAILVIDEGEKKVSSSAGHSLMKDHPFAKARFEQANKRTEVIVDTISNGDWDTFIKITESEALTLHAMMMTSEDNYILMKPETLLAMERIIAFRKETNIPVCFTLDAGPNVHVLYQQKDVEKVNDFLRNEFCQISSRIIFDEQGSGPEKIN